MLNSFYQASFELKATSYGFVNRQGSAMRWQPSRRIHPIVSTVLSTNVAHRGGVRRGKYRHVAVAWLISNITDYGNAPGKLLVLHPHLVHRITAIFEMGNTHT